MPCCVSVFMHYTSLMMHYNSKHMIKCLGCDTESDGPRLWVATQRKLPLNDIVSDGVFMLNSRPETWIDAVIRFGGVTIRNQIKSANMLKLKFSELQSDKYYGCRASFCLSPSLCWCHILNPCPNGLNHKFKPS